MKRKLIISIILWKYRENQFITLFSIAARRYVCDMPRFCEQNIKHKHKHITQIPVYQRLRFKRENIWKIYVLCVLKVQRLYAQVDAHRTVYVDTKRVIVHVFFFGDSHSGVEGLPFFF